MDQIEYVYTAGMTESEVDERLRESEAGVLSLADGGDAYAVPVSFHYDGASLHFRLGDEGDGRKFEFADATDRASFVLFDADGDDSWSVVAAGPLDRLSDAEADEYDAATLDERFGSLRVFGESVEETDLALYELRVEEVTGRRTVE
ncbi:pyridoxamine 5'-phosphate oxidase family protein [Candidatus Halobonum tyrrellensis]|uniref:Flavin-nucleotide-binding protein n=1 Tax=Candidatus Halobonum tyrrellensis G22 TaxID=1324957 RepID=V4GXU9_9EURY|nr:pyridoxamine 5'-phosphate oxidase family protein [Candidatus Halobonum tyrrellensis]ESP89986.1 flavin-nucleotide-binding protein [Candidatus Halobonum tyrrellensis G22]